MFSKSQQSARVIMLDRGHFTTCSVHLFGATITSWRINNLEQIFVNREAHFVNEALHGGMALSFPLNYKWVFGPKHGFARLCQDWRLEQPPKQLKNGDIEATLSLINSEYTESMWAVDFKLIYKITLREKELLTEFCISNTSIHYPMDFKMWVHCYFRVPDIENCEIEGLKDCTYYDLLLEDPAISLVEEREVITISEECNRVYKKSLEEVTIKNVVGGGDIKIIRKNLPEIKLFNPWIYKAKELTICCDDEYKYMLVMDSGIVFEPIKLKPLEVFKCSLRLIKVDLPKEDEDGLHKDIFSEVC